MNIFFVNLVLIIVFVFFHPSFQATLTKAKVKVFEMASKGDSMILNILNQGKPDIKEVAQELLGQSIYVAWPHMYEAK